MALIAFRRNYARRCVARSGAGRLDQCLPLSLVRAFATAINSTTLTIEPAAPRAMRVAETGGRLGFITPLTGDSRVAARI